MRKCFLSTIIMKLRASWSLIFHQLLSAGMNGRLLLGVAAGLITALGRRHTSALSGLHQIWESVWVIAAGWLCRRGSSVSFVCSAVARWGNTGTSLSSISSLRREFRLLDFSLPDYCINLQPHFTSVWSGLMTPWMRRPWLGRAAAKLS